MISRILMLLAVLSAALTPVSASRLRFVGGGPASSSYFVQDEFNGTLADTLIGTPHTGETGATWARGATSSAEGVLSDSNRVYGNPTGMMYASGIPADADYSVEMDMYTRSLVTGTQSTYIGARWATATVDGYVCGFLGDSGSSGTGNWNLGKFVSNSLSNIATPVPVTLVTATHYIIKLSVSGSTISCSLNGVQISGFSVTDTSHSAAGRAAFRFGGSASSNTLRNHIDYIHASDTP